MSRYLSAGVQIVESAKSLGNPDTVPLRITDYHRNDTRLASVHRYERRYGLRKPDGRRNTLDDLIAAVPFLPAGVGMVGPVFCDFLRPRQLWRYPRRKRCSEGLTGDR